MQQHVSDQQQTDFKEVAILAGGDVLALLLFVWIGRGSHALSIFDLAAVLYTAAPFVIGWFVTTPWFGLFRAEVIHTGRQWLPRLLLAWLVIGGPLALLLRNIFLGRPVGHIMPTFVLVTMAVTTLFLIIWRFGYGWWRQRHNQQNETAGA